MAVARFIFSSKVPFTDKTKRMKKACLSLALVTVLSLFTAGSSAFAASATWNGGAANWNSTNWTPAAAPGSTSSSTNTDTATFNTASAGTVTVDSGRNIQNITFDTNAGAFTLSGGSLILSSGGTLQIASTMTSGNTEAITTGITLEGNYTFADNGTTLGDLLTISTVTPAATGT